MRPPCSLLPLCPFTPSSIDVVRRFVRLPRLSQAHSTQPRLTLPSQPSARTPTLRTLSCAMSIHSYDLDGDGYADTVLSDSYQYDAGYYGDSYADPYYGADGDLYGYEGGLGMGGYGYNEPLWGYEEGYYPDLYDYTSFVDHSMPLYDAWGDDSWEEEQVRLRSFAPG